MQISEDFEVSQPPNKSTWEMFVLSVDWYIVSSDCREQFLFIECSNIWLQFRIGKAFIVITKSFLFYILIASILKGV